LPEFRPEGAPPKPNPKKYAGRRVWGTRSLEAPASASCLTDQGKTAGNKAGETRQNRRSAARRLRVLPASGYGRDRILDAQVAFPSDWSARDPGSASGSPALSQSIAMYPLSKMEEKPNAAGSRPPGAVDLSGPESPSRRPSGTLPKECQNSLNRPEPNHILRVCGRPAGAARGKSCIRP